LENGGFSTDNRGVDGVPNADRRVLSGKRFGEDTTDGMVGVGEIQMQHRLQERS